MTSNSSIPSNQGVLKIDYFWWHVSLTNSSVHYIVKMCLGNEHKMLVVGASGDNVVNRLLFLHLKRIF